jgi:hypothetical protein
LHFLHPITYFQASYIRADINHTRELLGVINMEDVVFWLVFIAFFASIAVPVCLLLYFSHRAGVETQLTVRKAIEQGQQLSPEILERLSEGASSPERDRRRGVIGIAIGIGLAILGFLMVEDLGIGLGVVGIGALPFLIGLAYLGLWKFSRRN